MEVERSCSVPYFSLICWVLGGIPQAPPPLCCVLSSAAVQGALVFLCHLILHLKHRIMGVALLPKADPQTPALCLMYSEWTYDVDGILINALLQVMAEPCHVFLMTITMDCCLILLKLHMLQMWNTHGFSMCILNCTLQQQCSWFLGQTLRKEYTVNGVSHSRVNLPLKRFSTQAFAL